MESDDEWAELCVISLRTWTVATYKNVPAERSILKPVIGNWTVYMTWNGNEDNTMRRLHSEEVMEPEDSTILRVDEP